MQILARLLFRKKNEKFEIKKYSKFFEKCDCDISDEIIQILYTGTFM